MKISDEQLLKTYDLYYKILFKIAYSYTFNSLDAEDIVQESFIKFCEKTYNEDELYNRNWLIRVTINKCVSFLRKKKSEIKALNSIREGNCLNDYEEDDKTLIIQKCLDKLDHNSKNIIILYYYNDFSVKEISTYLNISISNVTTRLNRAREKLKIFIKKEVSD